MINPDTKATAHVRMIEDGAYKAVQYNCRSMQYINISSGASFMPCSGGPKNIDPGCITNKSNGCPGSHWLDMPT